MWSTVAFLGWVLVTALMLLHRQIGGLLTAGLFATGALCLLRDWRFPHRAKALTTSWVGLMLLLMMMLVAPVIYDRAMNPPLSIMGSGVVSALLMVWIWRYYGLILVLAIPATLVRSHRLRSGIEKAAETYPWRFWWILPVFVFIKACIVAGVVSVVTNRLVIG